MSSVRWRAAARPSAQPLGVTRSLCASMNEVPYLAALSKHPRPKPDLDAIRSALESNGCWENHDEWRIFTVTTSRIELTQVEGRAVYAVSVACDQSFACHAPTLERAVEFMAVYQRLIQDLFWTLGWPSWASRRSPDP